MLHILLIIQAAVAAVTVPSGLTTSSVDELSLEWMAAIVRESQAFDEEKDYRRRQEAETEHIHRLGKASKRELARAVERATQAEEWSELLRLQRTQFNRLHRFPTDPISKVVLFIPGVPLAFRNDPCARILIPPDRRVMSIVHRIEKLTAKTKSRFSDIVRNRNTRQLSTWRETDTASVCDFIFKPETATELPDLIPMVPDRLDRVLMNPVQFEYAHRADKGGDQYTAGTTTMSDAAQRWVVESRRLLVIQAKRSLVRQQSFRRLLMKISAASMSPSNQLKAVDTKINQSQKLIHRLQREIHIMNRPGCSGVEDSDCISRIKKMGLLMRIAKESYDAGREQLNTTRLQTLRFDKRSVTPADAPLLPTQHTVSRNEMRLVKAIENLMTAELTRRKAFVFYAISLYRLETGRDPETTNVNRQREVLFNLATDRQPELDVIAAQKKLAEHQLHSMQRLYAEGYSTEEDVQQAATVLDCLNAERSRTELSAAVSVFCKHLFQCTNIQDDVAHMPAQHPTLNRSDVNHIQVVRH